MYWDDKPYYSLNYYLKEVYSEKVYKLALNGGMTCPNRDGLIDTRGCIFCSSGGSGEFTPPPTLPIKEQLSYAKDLLKNKHTGNKYIAYFQAYTNTYGPIEYLRNLFFNTIKDPDIVGISIATRPDCLGPEVLSLLKELTDCLPVFVELGLQTTNEDSASFIRRGYPTSTFDSAVKSLQNINVNIVAHMIIGLPGENKDTMLNTAMHLADLGVNGIKLQLLHIIKGTDLAKYYEKTHFHILSLEEYCDIVVSIIERLPQDMVIHRITGDGKRDTLIEPRWSLNKRNVLNTIHKTFKDNNTFQGKVR